MCCTGLPSRIAGTGRSVSPTCMEKTWLMLAISLFGLEKYQAGQGTRTVHMIGVAEIDLVGKAE